MPPTRETDSGVAGLQTMAAFTNRMDRWRKAKNVTTWKVHGEESKKIKQFIIDQLPDPKAKTTESLSDLTPAQLEEVYALNRGKFLCRSRYEQARADEPTSPQAAHMEGAHGHVPPKDSQPVLLSLPEGVDLDPRRNDFAAPAVATLPRTEVALTRTNQEKRKAVDPEDNESTGRRKKARVGGCLVEVTPAKADEENNMAQGPLGMRRAFDQDKARASKNTKTNDGWNKQHQSGQTSGSDIQPGYRQDNVARPTDQRCDPDLLIQAGGYPYLFSYSQPYRYQSTFEEALPRDPEAIKAASNAVPQTGPEESRYRHTSPTNQGLPPSGVYHYPLGETLAEVCDAVSDSFWSEAGVQNTFSGQGINDFSFNAPADLLDSPGTTQEDNDLFSVFTPDYTDPAGYVNTQYLMRPDPLPVPWYESANVPLAGQSKAYGHITGR